jgi:REP element-mobilizing transposase RayT
MIRDLVKQSRRSIRLTEYDYAQPGAYFITICTNNRECLFGEMADGAVLLNALGDIAVDELLRTAVVRHNVSVDALVRRGDPAGRPYMPNRAHGPAPGSVSAIVGQFKAAATKRINVLRGTPGVSVWQRNYYEHVIRDEGELNHIRQYITDNPAAWETDENNPNRHT